MFMYKTINSTDEWWWIFASEPQSNTDTQVTIIFFNQYAPNQWKAKTKRLLRILWLGVPLALRLRSDLVPEHGARAENDSWWALMWTHHFFKVPTPQFWNARVRVQGLDFVLEHWTGQWYIGYPVSEHSTILFRCPDTSARAPSVNTA